MASTYSDNRDKRRGIERQPIIAQRILDYFKNKGLNVIMEPATLFEDMRKHFDYKYICVAKQSFSKYEKINILKIDTKFGKTFTLFDNTGRNTLEHSESTFIVYELYEGANLLWLNTEKFKECLLKYPAETRNSKYEGNQSKYFFIEEYIKNNREFLGNFVKYIK